MAVNLSEEEVLDRPNLSRGDIVGDEAISLGAARLLTGTDRADDTPAPPPLLASLTPVEPRLPPLLTRSIPLTIRPPSGFGWGRNTSAATATTTS